MTTRGDRSVPSSRRKMIGTNVCLDVEERKALKLKVFFVLALDLLYLRRMEIVFYRF